MRLSNQVRWRDLDRRIGTVIAVLGLEPHEITDRLQITFEESEDDLDQLVAAAVRIGPRQYALVRHKHHPAPGTEVLTSCDSTSYAEDLHELLQELHLPESALTWTHPSIRKGQSQPVECVSSKSPITSISGPVSGRKKADKTLAKVASAGKGNKAKKG